MNKKEIIKYLKENELDIQRAHAFLFICDLAYSSYVNSKSIHGADFSPAFCFLSYNDGEPHYQLIAKKNIDSIAEKIWQDYLKNKTSLDKKILAHESLINDFNKIWRDYAKITSREFNRGNYLKIFKRFAAVADLWWKYGSIGENKGHVIESIIVPRFATRYKIDQEKARELVHILSHPAKQSFFNEERKDFYSLALKFAEGENIDQDINRYLRKYFWIKTDFCHAQTLNKEIIIKELAKEAKKYKTDKIKREIEKLSGSEKNIFEGKRKCAQRLKLTAIDKKDLYFAEKMIYWIDRRKKDMLHHLYFLWTFLKKVSEKTGVSYEQLNMLTVNELMDYLKTGKRLSEKELLVRKNGVFLVFEKRKKIKMFFGRDGKEMLEAATETDDKEVKGMVASQGVGGKIVGKVKVVMNIKRDKFNKGDILVTSMTRPEFIPLMHIAKAIITDEGGIACHAAIISRELGIPCIIGTKIATKVLKDGDVVEVDAEKGIVKILK